MNRFRWIWVCVLWALYSPDRIWAKEELQIFPAVAWRTTNHWEVQFEGLVFEREARPWLEAGLARSLGLAIGKLDAAERELFHQRAQPFLVDHERRERIQLKLPGSRTISARSRASGRYTFQFQLSEEEFAAFATNHTVQLRHETEDLELPLPIHRLDGPSVLVVSDIDDTLKESEVLRRQALLRNTLCRPFVAVPGMAEVYQAWATRGPVTFHYVSGSPWQLYAPLEAFLRETGFPTGSWHLREFRVKDRTAWHLTQPPDVHKMRALEFLLQRAPERSLVLVGDSGERDPEIYGNLARRYPDRIQAILIRDVTGDAADGPRYRRAFADLPPERCRVFSRPEEIRSYLSLPKGEPN